MLITGIRHKINSELDSRQSALFMRHLIHYLRMFAYLGVIIPCLIVVDYFCAPQIKDEKVTNKYHMVMDNLNHIEYHFFTDSYRFLSDKSFYENTNIKDNVTFYYTPIFNSVTYVSHVVGQGVYVCKPSNVYGWPLFVAGITFICSIIILVKTIGRTKKRESFKGDSMVIMGLINAFLCSITIIATIFQISY